MADAEPQPCLSVFGRLIWINTQSAHPIYSSGDDYRVRDFHAAKLPSKKDSQCYMSMFLPAPKSTH